MRLRSIAATATALAVALALAAVPAAAQSGSKEGAGPPGGAPPPPSLEGDPGYVDFAELGVHPPGRPKLRVNLYGALLHLVAEATRSDEPGFSELIEKLRGIFATVYEVPPEARAAIEKKATDTANRLQARGWQTVFEMHEGDGDSSYLQVHTDGDRILGLAVMFVEPDGTAGFINVVGDITPEDVGRLGRTFNIDALQRFEEPDAKTPEKQP